MATVFCTRCGQENPGDAAYCAQCGNPLFRAGELASEGGDRLSDSTTTISITGIEAMESDAEDDEPLPADASVESLPEDAALLVVKRGPNAGSRFLLDTESTTAGRHPESDIFLDDVTVSRRHAIFFREGAHFAVRDVGSLNGTYVNRERIDDTVLRSGDEVQVGKFRFVFLTARRQGEQ